MVFHVYVDGVTGTTPDAASVLAEAMAAHYGVPAADLLARIARGAFRVKANVDLATADGYARELAGFGARVRIEPAEGAAAPRAAEPAAARPPLPEAGPSASRTFSRSSLPPQPERAPARSSLSPQPERAPARSSLSPQVERPPVGKVPRPPTSEVLGALAAFDEGSLSLAMLDGNEAQEASPMFASSAFAPANGYAASAFAPANGYAAPPPVPNATRAAGRGTPPQDVDRFAPPSETEQELAVEIASDELQYHARISSVAASLVASHASSSHASPNASSSNASSSNASSSHASPNASSSHASSSHAPSSHASSSRASSSGTHATPAAPSWLADPLHRLAPPRARLAAGVLLAILLGFLPADIVATMRDHQMQREIDARVVAVQAAAADPDSYAALDHFRATQLAAKHSRHRAIVLGSLAIWVIAGGAVAAGWFRGIRWERYA